MNKSLIQRFLENRDYAEGAIILADVTALPLEVDRRHMPLMRHQVKKLIQLQESGVWPFNVKIAMHDDDRLAETYHLCHHTLNSPEHVDLLEFVKLIKQGRELSLLIHHMQGTLHSRILTLNKKECIFSQHDYVPNEIEEQITKISLELEQFQKDIELIPHAADALLKKHNPNGFK